jgi:arylsulfatase
MARSTSLVLVLALAATAAACGPGGPPSQPVELLARVPAVVVRDRGRVEPHATRGWGTRAVGRWQEWTVAGTDDHPAYVCALERRAGVRFSAAAPRDRTIVANLALFFDNAPDADGNRPPPRPVRVLLNGVLLDEVEVGVALLPHELHAPAAAWLVGQNVLEFEVEELVLSPWGDRLGVALGPLQLDARHDVLVETTARTLALDSGTSVTYRVEQGASAHLEIAGSASAFGLLRVTRRRVDGRTGAPSAVDEVRDQFDVEIGVPFARRLPLPAHAGEVHELELAWFSDTGGEVVLDRATLVPDRGVALTPVVVVALDTVAARHLEIHGYDRATAPNLAAFAEESIVFEDCASNATWTVPSFMALMTGQYPNAHEIEWRGAPGDAPLQQWEQRAIAANRWTLAESLRSAGYQTAGFVDNTWLSAQLGFAQGFDVWDDEAGFVPIEDRSGGLALVARKGLDWLGARAPDRPWFLFLHAFDAHGPYVAERPHRTAFAPDPRRDRAVRAGGVNLAYGIVHEYVARGEFPTGELPERISSEALRAAYDGGIRELDARLGELFAELGARGILDEALVVVLADHGETMGEHDFLFGHGVLDPAVTHVPLVVRLPGGRHGGRRIAAPVQLVDVAPTLLDFAGLGGARDYHSGRSLRAAIEDGERLPERPQFSFGGAVQNQRSVRLGRWRLWWSQPRLGALTLQLTHPRLPVAAVAERHPELARRGMTPAVHADLLARHGEEALLRFAASHLPETLVELHDLERDPDERVDVAAEHPDEVARLVELVEENRRAVRELRALAQHPRERPSLPDEALEALRQLGYADPVGDGR